MAAGSWRACFAEPKTAPFFAGALSQREREREELAFCRPNS
jgi:hypothetical protein